MCMSVCVCVCTVSMSCTLCDRVSTACCPCCWCQQKRVARWWGELDCVCLSADRTLPEAAPDAVPNAHAPGDRVVGVDGWGRHGHQLEHHDRGTPRRASAPLLRAVGPAGLRPHIGHRPRRHALELVSAAYLHPCYHIVAVFYMRLYPGFISPVPYMYFYDPLAQVIIIAHCMCCLPTSCRSVACMLANQHEAEHLSKCEANMAACWPEVALHVLVVATSPGGTECLIVLRRRVCTQLFVYAGPRVMPLPLQA